MTTSSKEVAFPTSIYDIYDDVVEIGGLKFSREHIRRMNDQSMKPANFGEIAKVIQKAAGPLNIDKDHVYDLLYQMWNGNDDALDQLHSYAEEVGITALSGMAAAGVSYMTGSEVSREDVRGFVFPTAEPTQAPANAAEIAEELFYN